jgi:hypothetical protein
MRNLLMLLTICGLPFLAGCNQSGSSEAGSTLSNAVFSILEPEPVCCCAAPVNERPESAPVEDYDPQAQPQIIASDSATDGGDS